MQYALRFWKRDTIYSFLTVLFGTGIFFFLLLSVRLQFHLNGNLSLSSIESLKSSPDLLFYLATFSLVFLVLYTVFPRTADFGVMMAVGGNPWVCVKIHLCLLTLLLVPSFFLANILNFILVQESGKENFLSDFVFSEFYCIITAAVLSFLVAVPSVLIATRKDAYSSIRRQK